MQLPQLVAPVAPVSVPTQDCAQDLHPGATARPQIDELIWPLRAVRAARLNAEVGERLRRIAPVEQCLCVLVDHGCAGLEAIAPRLHGTVSEELQRWYAALVIERDPLLARAAREWCALTGTIDEHCAWIRQQLHHADAIQAWFARSAADGGARHLLVAPARGWLSRGALFAFFSQRPADHAVLALFYAAQRLAAVLDLRYRPYTAQLLAMRISARERDVLRAALTGTIDREIAGRLGLSVDAVRYYLTRCKRRAPAVLLDIKPRDLARVLHELGTL